MEKWMLHELLQHYLRIIVPLFPLSQTADVRDMCYCGLTNKSCGEPEALNS